MCTAGSAGALSRRGGKFAVGGVTAAALFDMLRPNYALAVQVPPDDSRSRRATRRSPRRRETAPSKAISSVPPTPKSCPRVIVIHENRGLNPYIEDVARRLALANFIAFAPDGLTSVGGYPGDDEKGLALFAKVDPKRCRRTSSPPPNG